MASIRVIRNKYQTTKSLTGASVSGGTGGGTGGGGGGTIGNLQQVTDVGATTDNNMVIPDPINGDHATNKQWVEGYAIQDATNAVLLSRINTDNDASAVNKYLKAISVDQGTWEDGVDAEDVNAGTMRNGTFTFSDFGHSMSIGNSGVNPSIYGENGGLMLKSNLGGFSILELKQGVFGKGSASTLPVTVGSSSNRFDGLFSVEGNFNGDVTHNGYQSGWSGQKWLIDNNGVAEFDELFVRGSLTVNEFISNQINVRNGSLMVTDGAQVESIVEHTPNVRYIITTVEPHPFKRYDLIEIQAVNYDASGGKIVRNEIVEVIQQNTANDFHVAPYGGSDPTNIEVGDVMARIDNTNSVLNPDRLGLLYLTASDVGSPFMDVVYKKETGGGTRVRLGHLGGLSGFNQNSYGIVGYDSSNNAAFWINETNAQISKFEFDQNRLKTTLNNDWRMILGEPSTGDNTNSSENGIRLYQDSSVSGNYGEILISTESGGANSEIRMLNSVASDSIILNSGGSAEFAKSSATPIIFGNNGVATFNTTTSIKEHRFIPNTIPLATALGFDWNDANVVLDLDLLDFLDTDLIELVVDQSIAVSAIPRTGIINLRMPTDANFNDSYIDRLVNRKMRIVTTVGNLNSGHWVKLRYGVWIQPATAKNQGYASNYGSNKTSIWTSDAGYIIGDADYVDDNPAEANPMIIDVTCMEIRNGGARGLAWHFDTSISN